MLIFERTGMLSASSSAVITAYLRYLRSQADDMILKNVAGQKLTVVAINTTTGAVVTGDAANITAQTSLDGAAPGASNDVNPTELGTTGHYQFDLTQAETNGDLFVFAPVSSTGNTVVIALPSNAIYTVEAVTPADKFVLADTTIATLSTQTSFTLTAGSGDDDAYNGCIAIIEDVSSSVQKAVVIIDDYVGSTRTVTLKSAPVFTIAATDKITILANTGYVNSLTSDGSSAFQSAMTAQGYSVARAALLDFLTQADTTSVAQIISAMTTPSTFP